MDINITTKVPSLSKENILYYFYEFKIFLNNVWDQTIYMITKALCVEFHARIGCEINYYCVTILHKIIEN